MVAAGVRHRRQHAGVGELRQRLLKISPCHATASGTARPVAKFDLVVREGIERCRVAAPPGGDEAGRRQDRARHEVVRPAAEIAHVVASAGRKQDKARPREGSRQKAFGLPEGKITPCGGSSARASSAYRPFEAGACRVLRRIGVALVAHPREKQNLRPFGGGRRFPRSVVPLRLRSRGNGSTFVMAVSPHAKQSLRKEHHQPEHG